MNELLVLINTILLNRGKSPINSITDNSNLRSDFGFDSLDLAELTARIEMIYNVDIFESGIVETIGEVRQRINEK